MFWVLFFTVIGFLAGLALVMVQRKVRPGKLLAATFIGLVIAGIVKIMKDSNRQRRHYN